MLQTNSVFPVLSVAVKYLWALLGALLALLQPTIPFIVICTIFVFCDCFTAWQLSRRVKRRYPGKADGKFKSKDAKRVVETLVKIYALVILAHLLDTHVLGFMDLKLANIVSGAACFVQFWSMLENESSCNEAKWARLLQKILIDKTERHFDIDLSELKKEATDGEH